MTSDALSNIFVVNGEKFIVALMDRDLRSRKMKPILNLVYQIIEMKRGRAATSVGSLRQTGNKNLFARTAVPPAGGEPPRAY